MKKRNIAVFMGMILLPLSFGSAAAGVNVSEKLSMLQSDAPADRRAAISALSGEDSEEVIQAVAGLLTSDTDFTVRARAAEILGNIRSRKAIPYLLDALEDENRNVKASAIVALGYIRDSNAVEPLMDFVRREENEGLRISALNVLGIIPDDRSVPLLMDSLNSESGRIRRIAAQSLGRLRSGEAVRALTDAASDEDKNVRLYAVRALGEIGEEEAAGSLKSLLNREDDIELKVAIAHSLGQLGLDDGYSVALDAARSDDTRIKRSGLRALGIIGKSDAEVENIVIEAYNSDDSSVKRDAQTAASFLNIDLP